MKCAEKLQKTSVGNLYNRITRKVPGTRLVRSPVPLPGSRAAVECAPRLSALPGPTLTYSNLF